METRRIGSLDVSAVGLGCMNFGWRIDENESVKVIDAALDAGINFFDTADIYGKGQSEERIGKVMKVDLPRPRTRKALLEHPSYYRYREELMTFLEEHERKKEKAA